jgi:hypothetical protein
MHIPLPGHRQYIIDLDHLSLAVLHSSFSPIHLLVILLLGDLTSKIWQSRNDAHLQKKHLLGSRSCASMSMHPRICTLHLGQVTQLQVRIHHQYQHISNLHQSLNLFNRAHNKLSWLKT